MISLRGSNQRMGFLLALAAGHYTAQDLEQIILAESQQPTTRARAVSIYGQTYASITEAARQEMILRRGAGQLPARATAAEHHAAIENIRNQFSRALRSGQPGFKYL